MKFIIAGNDWISLLERLTYDGAIGIFYTGTWNALLAFIIVGLLCVFAVIGLITVIALIFRPRKSKMSSSEKWLKTGNW